MSFASSGDASFQSGIMAWTNELGRVSSTAEKGVLVATVADDAVEMGPEVKACNLANRLR